MSKFIIVIFSLLLVTMVILGGCIRPVMTYESILNKNHHIVEIDSTMYIDATDLYLRLANSDLVPNGGILDSTTYFDTLQKIVLDSLVSLEAQNFDLTEAPSFYRIYQFRYREFYVDRIAQLLFYDSVVIDSARVDSFIEAHREAYTYEEQVHARHVVLSPEGYKYGEDSLAYKDYTDEQLEELCEMKINELKAEIDSGAEFGQVAFENSMHRASGDNDGDLSYFTRHKYRKEFTEVAFNTPVGEVSDPFRTLDGWHLVQVLDHVDSGLAEITPELYAQAESNCREHLANRMAAVFVDSLFQTAKMIFNDSAIQAGVMNVPDTTWALIINDLDTLNFYRIGDYLHQYKTGMEVDQLSPMDIKQSFAYRSVKFLMQQAGDKLGLDKVPDIAKERESLYHKYCINAIRQNREVYDYVPSDSLIEDYYKHHVDEYVIDRPIYVQHIICEDSLFAEFLRDQALSGIDFLELARQHYPGAEEIRTAAADLGWIGPYDMPEEFYERARVTAIDQISYPVKTNLGYHIIKVVDKKYSKSLDQVSSQILHILTKQYKADYSRQWDKDLIASHYVKYNLDRLKKIKLDAKDRR